MRNSWTKLSVPYRILMGVLCFVCIVCPVAWFLYEAAPPYDRNEQLCDAAREGRTADVQRFLDYGADPNFTHYGASALESAADSGNYQTTLLLWQHGAKLGAGQPGRTPSGQDALRAARERKDTAMIRLLEEAGATD